MQCAHAKSSAADLVISPAFRLSPRRLLSPPAHSLATGRPFGGMTASASKLSASFNNREEAYNMYCGKGRARTQDLGYQSGAIWSWSLRYTPGSISIYNCLLQARSASRADHVANVPACQRCCQEPKKKMRNRRNPQQSGVGLNTSKNT